MKIPTIVRAVAFVMLCAILAIPAVIFIIGLAAFFILLEAWEWMMGRSDREPS